MCGRLNIHDHPGIAQFLRDMGIIDVPVYEHKYNVSPTAFVPVLYRDSPIGADAMQWGITPPWDPKGRPIVNAMAETVWDKKTFQKAIRESRCIILANGFYEWRRSDKGKKPHHIHMSRSPVMLLAGLWRNAPGEEPKVQCAILTTGANEAVSRIHNRMPVILDRQAIEPWLNSEDRGLLDALMVPCPDDWLKIDAVSGFVNNSRNDGPDCIEPVDGDSE